MTTNDQQVPDADSHVEAESIEELYVAFCDILGFADRVIAEFDATVDATRKLADLLSGEVFKAMDVKITMYSDSILVVGRNLAEVLSTVQGIWFFALASDFMIRGAITKGRYYEKHTNNDLIVVSDALVRAVKLEKQVSVPAVMIADDVEIPDEFWYKQFIPYPDGNAIAVTSLLHFRERNIVNPFNRYWLLSAGARATRLMEKYPLHKDKYLWFLALHQAVTEQHQLVPPSILAKLIKDGIVKFVPFDSGNNNRSEKDVNA